MRKLFIILVGLIAIVTFIRAFDNFSSLNAGISKGANYEGSLTDQSSFLPEVETSP